MSKKLPPDYLKKLKENLNIVEIVGEHVVLRKSGAGYSGLCPFHGERTPSFNVNESKQLYHCYGCKKGGDLLSFFMDIHGLNFMEAIEELAERAKLPLPKGFGASDDPAVSERDRKAKEKLDVAFKLNRFAATFYHQQFQTQTMTRGGIAPELARYLTERGLTEQEWKEFYLGYASPAWDGLTNHLTNAKAPLPIAEELGLIRPSKNEAVAKGRTHYDLFRNRVLFPILDLRGKVVGFGGRALDKEDTGPKYLNSSESLIYQKSRIIYGLYQAQRYIREKNEVILVEGYFDTTVLHAKGFKNTVAISGTSFTAEHLALLSRFTDRMIVLLDNDSAGQSATLRAMELGLANGKILYSATLPPKVDPDELVLSEGGVEKLDALLKSARPIFDQELDKLIAQGLKDSEGKAQAIKQALEWFKKYNDPVGREVRRDYFEKKLGLQGSGLLGGPPIAAGRPGPSYPSHPPEYRRGPMGNGNTFPVNRNPQARAKPPGALSSRERVVLVAILRGGKGSEMIAAHRQTWPQEVSMIDLFDHSLVRELVDRIFQTPGLLERLRADPAGTFSELEQGADPRVRTLIVEALIAKEDPYSDEDLKLALDRSLSRALERFSQRVLAAIAAAEAKQDADLETRLKKEYLDVQRKMKELNTFYDEA